MSTDITIEAAPTTTLSFDEFTREHLPLVARAVQVLAQDSEQADAAITSGVTSVAHNWSQQRDMEQAQQHVFGQAVRHCRQHSDTPDPDATDPDTAADEVSAMAISLAHHMFDWNAAAITRMLGVTADIVFEHVGDNDAGEQLRHRVDQADPAYVDLQAIVASPASSRRRTIALLLGGIAALLALGVLAQFVANPTRNEQAQGASPPVASPSVAAEPFERPTFPGENMDLEASVPVLPIAQQAIVPSLITNGMTEGFVGINPPAELNDAIVFVSSTNGLSWESAASWDLGPDTTISRFERAGDQFAVWFETDTGRNRAAPGLALSQDLQTWTTFDLPAAEPPFGLIYQSEFIDVAASSDLVLALVATKVEIDFAALLLSEGYTCGHSIASDAVSINMCNAQLDVWTASEGEQLPPQSRLLVSRDGQPFEDGPVPFGAQVEPQLRVANGEFVLTDSAGLGFATSTNAQGWQAGAAQQPPFPVQMSVANHRGQVLGVGQAVDGQAALFFNDGPNTTSTLLTQIVADAGTEATVLVASTPTRWAMYVYEPDGRAWIAVSNNGLNWNVADAGAPGGTDVRLIASDDTGLVQFVDDDGETSTIVMPLPNPLPG